MLGPEEIANRVGFHKATVEGANATLPKHAHLRRLFTQVMTELDEVLPDGRAKSVAFTELENASMWAHKSVAELAPLVSEGSQDTAQLENDFDKVFGIMEEAVRNTEASQGTFLPVALANDIAQKIVESITPTAKTDQAVKDLLEQTLVARWSEKTDRRSDESKRDFLERMQRAGLVSEQEYNTIYA